ncbi:FmdB family zinc ribbon protein [Halomonas halodenitrificans]|uniref:FmdB family zinc ribbon protein n=1 Tax=Halomonas halodenitrificans TaxID=28252 RepID=UPI000684CF26|nr:zinc ribbon domain-containing protein [Halomonas halodenitrificans]
MPIYEFHCCRCGCFDALVSMSQREAPRACPGCGETATRRLSAPRLALMPTALRQAHTINERSAHEPKSQHGCRHDHATASTGRDTRPRAGRGRPWMLGH